MSECSVKHLKWGATWPSREQFHELADAGYRVIPIVRRLLADSLTPVGFYERLAGGRSGTFILESAEYGGTWSRYSFIGVNSMAQLRSNNGQADWLGKVPVGVPVTGDVVEVAHATLKTLKAPHVEGLPNLTSGLVGTVGWDAIRHWEPTLRAEAPDETGQPETVLALATDIAVVDHVSGSVWLIANAVNVDDKSTRADAAYNEAVARLDQMQRDAATPAPDESRVNILDETVAQPELRFRTEKSHYEQAVERAKQYIVDGDVFQVVISQRLDIDSPADPFDVYRVLRTLNPSPYMYFMALTDAQGRDFNVIGSSPETLIKVDNGHAMTFPIAGSRPRGATPEEDEKFAKELLAEAGWTEGADGILERDGERLSIELISPGVSEIEKAALIMQEDMKKAGIELTLKNVDFSQYFDALYGAEPNFELAYQGTGMAKGMTSNWKYIYAMPAAVPGRYENPEVTALFEKAATKDEEIKREAYSEIQRLVSIDCPDIPLYEGNSLYATNQSVNFDEAKFDGSGIIVVYPEKIFVNQ